ncbi:MAG: hypothetical protein PHZ25_00035 [Candidatus Pacebacteria bacterium]|nr:hypothetical protein [Candidatus Paceibacterota bacterium]
MNIKKILGIILILIVIALIGFYFYNNESGSYKNELFNSEINPLNAVYEVEGGIFSIKGGVAEEKVNSMSRDAVEVKIFGQPVFGDLNQDGNEEAAVIISYKNDRGEAFYVAAAVREKNDQETKGTNALVLGEGAMPKNILIKEGKILVSYEVKTKDSSLVEIEGRFRLEGTELKPSN